MILLDTHTLVWLSEGNDKLGERSLSLINKALKSKELFVSPITFWEVAMLVEKKRLKMSLSVDGKIYQKGNTSTMYYKVPFIVSCRFKFYDIIARGYYINGYTSRRWNRTKTRSIFERQSGHGI